MLDAHDLTTIPKIVKSAPAGPEPFPGRNDALEAHWEYEHRLMLDISAPEARQQSGKWRRSTLRKVKKILRLRSAMASLQLSLDPRGR